MTTASSVNTPALPERVPRWLRAVLGVPLLGKIAGATVLVVAVIVGTTVAVSGASALDRETILVILAAVVGALGATLLLVWLALRPLAELEALADRVLAGDLEARARPSLLADRDIARLGRSINVLLDALVSDRARMRRLAAEVIRTQDAERSQLARELHESIAQELAAQMLQLAAAAREVENTSLRDRLQDIGSQVGHTLEELRGLSQQMYPQVLEDLGLAAAVGRLARQARSHQQLEVHVDADPDVARIPRAAAAVLYRVAREGIENAARHARAGTVQVGLSVDDSSATLDIRDDGTGFDMEEAEARRPTMGIFSMRERVSLAGGHFELETERGRGTRIRAMVPFTPPREV